MKRPSKLRIVILLVVGVLLLSLLFGGPTSPTIEPGSTLVIELEGGYVEAPRAPLVARLLGERRQPFAALLSTLAMAARDDRLSGVVLVVRPLGLGWGKAGELRGAIARLREAGRKTTAILDIASFSASREYFVASAADEVFVVPGGAVPVVGLAAEYFFLGGLWQKLGVEFEVGKAGKYKSAVESYAGTGMSPPSREMANSLLDSTFEAFVGGIAESRGMEAAQVHAAIDSGPMLPAELEQHGLVDGTLYIDEVLDRAGGEIVRESTYVQIDPAELGFAPVARVALVYGTGTVVQGRGDRSPGGPPVFASQTVSEAILEAADDASIDAIILRIDSPGGSALAAEQIWRAIGRARQKDKPIVASFSDLAASGGYYVAVAADSIVSTGGALTGSIGVFALRPVLGSALEKLGVGLESMTRGRYADFLLAGEPLSEGARSRLQAIVLDTYRIFVERVADGRELTAAQVDAIGQGRVWTGRQALEIGLVDEIGGLHTAVDHVRKALDLAEKADVALIPFPAPRSLGEEIADALNTRIAVMARAAWPIPAAMQWIETWLALLPTDAPVLLPPYLVEIR
jgi:protease-4